MLLKYLPETKVQISEELEEVVKELRAERKKEKKNTNLSPEELKIKDGDILAMVTNIKGLDIVHVGFAFWKDNQLHLLHASSVAKKVIEDPQTQYESSKKTKAHIGVRAIRFIW